jgi:hypothetical protein
MPTGRSESTCGMPDRPSEVDSTLCVHFTRILTPARPCASDAEIALLSPPSARRSPTRAPIVTKWNFTRRLRVQLAIGSRQINGAHHEQKSSHRTVLTAQTSAQGRRSPTGPGLNPQDASSIDMNCRSTTSLSAVSRQGNPNCVMVLSPSGLRHCRYGHWRWPFSVYAAAAKRRTPRGRPP